MNNKNNFRLQAKKLFLTYPQCDVDKGDALVKIMELFLDYDVEWIVVAREKHKDGSNHLHCAINLNTKLHTRNPHKLDCIGGKHGNYQVMRNPSKVLAYIIKDGDYVEHGITVEDYLNCIKSKTSTKSCVVATKILQRDWAMEDVLAEYPGFFMMNKRKIEDFYSYVVLMSEEKQVDWYGIRSKSQTKVEKRIEKWINKNVREVREFKQRQLYIYGPPNTGKTSLINLLEKSLHIYYMPVEDFYDHYEDGIYDMVVLDEFKGQKSITFLNKWLQGGPCPIRKKGSQAVKMHNVPMIILSNYCLDDCYKHVDPMALESLKARLEIIPVEQYLEYRLKTSDDLILDEMFIPQREDLSILDEMYTEEEDTEIIEID